MGCVQLLQCHQLTCDLAAQSVAAHSTVQHQMRAISKGALIYKLLTTHSMRAALPKRSIIPVL
jgi:hypothetical protein